MELFTELGLKEISSIIGTMGKNTDVNLHEEIEVDGKDYTYCKKGNELVVKGEDGKETKIRINYSSEKTKDYKNTDIIVLKHEVFLDYLLKNGDSISLYNDIGLDPGYETFENVQRHDLMSGLRTKYCDKDGKELASFSLEFDKICVKDNNRVYEFTKDGIKVGNRLITLNGDKLIAISDFKVPSKEEAESFNLENEEKKVEEIINNSKNLHPFSLELLDEAKRKLSMKDRYAKTILDFYNNDVKDVRKAIEVRQKLINSLEDSFIKSEVLEAVDKDLTERTKKRYVTKALIH